MTQQWERADFATLTGAVEALLFVADRPINTDTLCRQWALLSPSAASWEQALHWLQSRYREQQRPYRLRRRAEGWSMELRPTLRQALALAVKPKRSVKLTRSAIEVLAAVAFRQPITAAAVDLLVGYEAKPLLRQLLRRGLVQPLVDPPDHWQTTARFLALFRLKDLKSLPTIEDLERR